MPPQCPLPRILPDTSFWNHFLSVSSFLELILQIYIESVRIYWQSLHISKTFVLLHFVIVLKEYFVGLLERDSPYVFFLIKLMSAACIILLLYHANLSKYSLKGDPSLLDDRQVQFPVCTRLPDQYLNLLISFILGLYNIATSFSLKRIVKQAQKRREKEP